MEPRYYRFNMGKLSWLECWTLSQGHPLKLVSAMARKAAGELGRDAVRLPTRMADLKVEAHELTQDCWQALALDWAAFQKAGFHTPVHLKVRDLMGYLDNGAIRCLHDRGKLVGSLLYLKVATRMGPRQRLGMAVAARLESGHIVSVRQGQINTPTCPQHTLLRCPSPGPMAMQRYLEKYLQEKYPGAPLCTFDTLATVAALHDELQILELQHKLARGLLVPVSDNEAKALHG